LNADEDVSTPPALSRTRAASRADRHAQPPGAGPPGSAERRAARGL